MFLVTAPDGTLVGAATTRDEIVDIINKHAVPIVQRELEGRPDDQEDGSWIMARYLELFVQYRIEKVV